MLLVAQAHGVRDVGSSYSGLWCHGVGQSFLCHCNARHRCAGMSVDEAMICAQACMQEMRTRFLINYADFTIRLVDKDGVRTLATEAAMM